MRYNSYITPCIILDKRIFENFVLADETFAKAFTMFETCASVNNNLYGKSVSSLEIPIKCDERFKVTSVPIFIPDFNLSCELNNYIESFYTNIILKQNKIIIL